MAASDDAAGGSVADGKRVFLEGLGEGGTAIRASVGKPATEVSAAILPCVNCHGRDGRGRKEGGLNPSDIRWLELTKPYGESTAARRRGAYDEGTLIRAIAMGIDSSGNKLDPAMPRFQLTVGDARNLVEYLKILGTETDPGIGNSAVKIGVVLPPERTFGAMRRSIRETLLAFAGEMNDAGGIYGRKLELCFGTAPEEPRLRANAVRDFVDKEQPFALVSSFIAGGEREIIPCLEEKGIPIIGPVCLYSEDRKPPNRHVFHLFSGLAGQSKALVDFAAGLEPLRQTSILLVQPSGDPEMETIADAVEERASEKGWTFQKVAVDGQSSPDWTGIVSTGRIGAVFWLAPGSALPGFAKAVGDSEAPPFLFGPSALIGQEIFSLPKSFSGRAFVSFPALATDQTVTGRKEFMELAEAGKFSQGGLATRLAALSAAKVLVQGMQQTGRALTRERLVDELERLYQFSTGQTPPITFGANRRIGADGVHVVAADLEHGEFAFPATWVVLK